MRAATVAEVTGRRTTTATERLEAVLEALRANGGRVTTSRRAIVQVLVESAGHATAEQITELVQNRHPDVHASTVYRLLDDLEQLGVVDHVHLGHGPAVYHFVDDAHQHLSCEECGTVIEVPAKLFETLRKRLLADFDFDLDPRHFALSGRCSACRATAT